MSGILAKKQISTEEEIASYVSRKFRSFGNACCISAGAITKAMHSLHLYFTVFQVQSAFVKLCFAF